MAGLEQCIESSKMCLLRTFILNVSSSFCVTIFLQWSLSNCSSVMQLSLHININNHVMYKQKLTLWVLEECILIYQEIKGYVEIHHHYHLTGD